MRNRDIDVPPSAIEPVLSDEEAEYRDLVDYCEYVLVLCPEPLWQHWKIRAPVDDD
ncbi:MAG TPA: hypothetical protein VNM24_05590 [Burkholderiales bacterium]|jgi:hypothetical protein|nr:hypothetical protein [Burkholderiales bacterium]